MKRFFSKNNGINYLSSETQELTNGGICSVKPLVKCFYKRVFSKEKNLASAPHVQSCKSL